MKVATRATKRHKKYGFRGLIIIAAILCLAIFLITYIGKIPKDMISLFLSNPEAHSFVIDYPSHINDTDIGEISPLSCQATFHASSNGTNAGDITLTAQVFLVLQAAGQPAFRW